MIIARQSTARTVMVGPVLDADGVAVTDAVVGDFKISKNGGAPAALNGSATLTHRNTGHYSLALTTSDLDTVGQAEIVIDDTTNACPVKEITVIEEAVYDISFASSATGAVPVASIANNAITASAIASDAITAAKIASSAITNAKFAAGAIDASAIADNAIDAGAIASNALALAKVATDLRQAFGLNLSGTLSGTHSDTTADLGASAPTEDVTGQTLFFPAHQLSRVITSYNTGTGVATFDSIGVTLANSDVWHLFATAPGSGGGGGGDATEAKQDTIIALIGTPSVDLATDIAAVKSDTAAILVDTGTTLQGELDAIQAVTDKLDDTLEDQGGGTYGFTEAALQEAPSAGGGSDWDADERTAIRAILGIPASGTTPDDPTTGILDTIRDAVATRASQSSVDTIDGNVDAILADTADMQPKLGTPAGASMSADIAAVKAQTAAIETDTQDIQSRLPAALVNSRMDCTIDGTGMEAGAVTAVQNGLATSAALATVDTVVDGIKAVTDALPDAGALTSIAQASALATVDSNVDAVKAKTDSLTFTEAGAVDARITWVSETELAAAGTGGQGYGAAP